MNQSDESPRRWDSLKPGTIIGFRDRKEENTHIGVILSDVYTKSPTSKYILDGHMIWNMWEDRGWSYRVTISLEQLVDGGWYVIAEPT